MVRTVHPHIRGAYHGDQVPGLRPLGSSPHTWGILFLLFVGFTKVRFIPTYVGHTSSENVRDRQLSVHPHIRGAYDYLLFGPRPLYGSSPHTWGIRIPKHPLVASHTVHPHIRGAYGRFEFASLFDRGSSPHTWGIHWTAVRKMAGFSHFSYDFTQKSYFVQGLVFFGVIGAEAFPTHRRGRSQCLPGAHGGSVRNL